jgi:DNA mismatch repair ATPase MutS
MDACVRNDICWDDARRFYVISGSNMAGKSTLLRTIGLNLVLAYAGAPVCAERMTASRLAICASIAVQDSLLNGKSKFMAEMERIKLALNVPSEEGPVLFLVDEILSGTNSKDRRMAAEAILRALLQQGAVGALSTHDLALTELAELPELAGANIHMGSRIDSDPMDFDYLLKPGITNQSSALAIARLAGVAV